jgi:heme/copper-type cytochrome/quinol oxidase subunit 2
MLQAFHILIIIAVFVVLIIVFTALVLWARKHRKGANLVAATFSFIAPDPLFERNIKIVQESQNQVKEAESEAGDPPVP